MYQNTPGRTLILVQVMGPQSLGSLCSWGILSAAPAPASSVWCCGSGVAPDPGEALVEASIQPPTHLFLKCLGVSGALLLLQKARLGRSNFWTSLLRSFKILGFSLWRSLRKGKGYWKVGGSSSLTFWNTRIARSKRSCRIKPMVSNAGAGFPSDHATLRPKTRKHLKSISGFSPVKQLQT